MTQHRQNSRPKLKHKKSTKRYIEEASGPGQAEPTTAGGGRRTAMHPATDGRACLCCLEFFRFLSRLFVFPRFCCFSPYNADVSGHLRIANSLPSTLLSSRLALDQFFRERKRERRRTARILCRASIERLKHDLAEQFLFLPFSFLTLVCVL